jgi:hypothetical protein
LRTIADGRFDHAVHDMSGTLGRLGHLLIAIAEPHRETLADYNRWFEAEHMYDAVLVGPGAFAANRYVATRELKGLRYPLDGGVFADPSLGSYVALYYLAPGTAEEHFAWSFPQNRWLGETGRNNADRTLVQTWLCDHVDTVTRPDHAVPPHVALDHPYRSMAMAYVDPPAGAERVDVRVLREQLANAAVESPVAQAQLWSPRDFPDTQGVPTTPGTVAPNRSAGRQAVAVLFLDADVEQAWPFLASLGDGLRAADAGALRLLTVWRPVVRGTQTYADELW